MSAILSPGVASALLGSIGIVLLADRVRDGLVMMGLCLAVIFGWMFAWRQLVELAWDRIQALDPLNFDTAELFLLNAAAAVFSFLAVLAVFAVIPGLRRPIPPRIAFPIAVLLTFGSLSEPILPLALDGAAWLFALLGLLVLAVGTALTFAFSKSQG